MFQILLALKFFNMAFNLPSLGFQRNTEEKQPTKILQFYHPSISQKLQVNIEVFKSHHEKYNLFV